MHTYMEARMHPNIPAQKCNKYKYAYTSFTSNRIFRNCIPTSKALIICRAAASLRAIVVDRLLVFAEVVAVPLHSSMPSALPAATE